MFRPSSSTPWCRRKRLHESNKPELPPLRSRRPMPLLQQCSSHTFLPTANVCYRHNRHSRFAVLIGLTRWSLKPASFAAFLSLVLTVAGHGDQPDVVPLWSPPNLLGEFVAGHLGHGDVREISTRAFPVQSSPRLPLHSRCAYLLPLRSQKCGDYQGGGSADRPQSEFYGMENAPVPPGNRVLPQEQHRWLEESEVER